MLAGRLRKLVLCVLLGTAWAAGFAAPPGIANVVEGETLVAGAAGTYADVTLDRPMRVTSTDPARWLDATFEGEGEILGIEIRGTAPPADPIRRSPPAVRIYRAGRPGDGVQAKVAVGVDGGVLPAGAYRIYLISDKPSSARLRFPDQPGRARIEANRAYPFWGGVLPQRRLPDGTVILGAERPMPTRGLLLMNLMPFDDAERMVADRFEVCVYSGGAAGEAGSLAFGPGCPGGRTMREYSRSSTDVRYVTFMVDSAPVGMTGFGGNLERLGTSSEIYAAGAWVGYVEDEPPVPAGAPPSVPAPALPKHLELRSKRLRNVRGRALAHVRCPGPGRCRGSARVDAGRALRYDVPAAARRTLRVPLPRSLRRARRARATLTLVSSNESAQRTERVRVTVGR